MKKKVIKTMCILITLCILSIILYINIYPPIFEIPGTYHEYDNAENARLEIDKYYLVQNPPKSNNDFVGMVKDHLKETDEVDMLLKENINKNPGKDIEIKIRFCRKSYSPFGLHRFWRAERWDYIQSYSQYYIGYYYLLYSDGICTEQYSVINWSGTSFSECLETNTFEYEV